MSKQALVPINILASQVTPAGEYVGDAYFNENTQSLFVYNGLTWAEFVPAVTSEMGGAPNTSYFGNSIDSGTPTETTFDYTYDGGIFS